MGTKNQGLHRPQKPFQDVLGLISDHIYWWGLLFKEYGPKIVLIKGIHDTVADSISRLGLVWSRMKRLIGWYSWSADVTTPCMLLQKRVFMITKTKSTWSSPAEQSRCNLHLNSKGKCTIPKGQCSPEETQEDRQAFYSVCRGYSSTMQGRWDGHPLQPSEVCS